MRYQDYRALLDRKDVDVVVYATPEHWHYLPCIHAAQAGKDIYGEQPLSHTIREGRVMVDAVRKYKRVFQTGEQQRSNPKNAQSRGTDPQRPHRQDPIDHRLQLSQSLRVQFPSPAGPGDARLGSVVRPERSRALQRESLCVARPLRARTDLPAPAGREVRRWSGLDVVPALFGRRTAQLGLPWAEHGPVGSADGQQRSGRGLGRPGREDGDGRLRHDRKREIAGMRPAASPSSTTSMPTVWC